MFFKLGNSIPARLIMSIPYRHYRAAVAEQAIIPNINDYSSNLNFDSLSAKSITSSLISMSNQKANRLFFDFELRSNVIERFKSLIQTATHNLEAKKQLHEILSMLYERRFQVPPIEKIGLGANYLLNDICFLLENHLLDHIDELVNDQVSKLEIPKTGKAYVQWIMNIIQRHLAAKHPYYNEFMLNKANKNDVKYWLAQESTLDQKFDDILALMQVGTSGPVKMEIASNYWDEMGNGEPLKTHTYLFELLLNELDVTSEYIRDNLLLTSLITGNISTCYVLNKNLFYQAIGYFGVTEYLAPIRFKNVVKALERNEISDAGKQYHKLHIWIDKIHGAAWFNNVVRKMIDKQPECGKEIIKGALVRLQTSVEHLNSFPSSTHIPLQTQTKIKI
ncbi:unnamed protein product [Didymodactylos carnosus]|uniref:Iron-containing redox enzyme family protein n=1 Tax=Didymodactylos carnosus TaxID=1234261 RepID=A0A815IBI4_9BILA|nr:unnamed protein product [Didymodactylos carnosus]CAF1477084.1 unnamed protein product [Didymodactylos carnosus]CAF4247932.1 unnamed protein product [Didymodactylos carnosus]CAF4268056.1 unnamed protein product [Didymodactylos carnosus]